MSIRKKQLHNFLASIIEQKTHLKKDKDGHYYDKAYVDSGEELSDETIRTIVTSSKPMNTFYNMFEPLSPDHGSIQEIIKNNWQKEFGSHDHRKDDIQNWLYENVYICYPYERFLSKELNVNIIVDTGDGNYDFTLNNFASYNATEDEEINSKSSILWLNKQQGYTKKDLVAIFKPQCSIKMSQFLESIYIECTNVTSHMNALTFFVKMTLGDLIAYLERPTDITLTEKSVCGLYDCWNGAGGILDIKLRKPVVIPKEYANPHVDGTRGYGVSEIYGLGNDFWQDTIKKGGAL